MVWKVKKEMPIGRGMFKRGRFRPLTALMLPMMKSAYLKNPRIPRFMKTENKRLPFAFSGFPSLLALSISRPTV